MKRFLEEARKFIRLNSVTSNGDEELVNFSQSLLQERGFKAQLQHVTHAIDSISKRQFNVVAILGDPLVDRKIRKGILLFSRLDTPVPGLPENWDETAMDPFAANIKDGNLYGLGAGLKLDFLCKIYAAARFRERKLKQPIYIVGACGGEYGALGAKYLIKSGTLNPRCVLVGEPTGLRLVRAHKAMLQYRVSIGYQQIERDARGFNRRIDFRTSGKTAHGAHPDRGVNAIQQTLGFLQRASESGFEIRFTRFEGGDAVNQVPDRARAEFYLTSHQFEDFKRFFREVVRTTGEERRFKVELGGLGETGVRFLPDAIFPCLLEVTEFFATVAEDFRKVRDDQYDPPHSTVSLGTLSQQQTRIDLGFDVRLLPDIVTDEVEKHLQQGIQNIAAKYPNLNISLSRERLNPGLLLPEGGEFQGICQDALRSCDMNAETAAIPASTEASLYSQAGYDALAFGAGEPGITHGPNERVPLEQLEKTVTFYERVIERVCT